ncbi:MAG: helix-turn-helix domain-containing protein [Anaerovoracaceae bacterium]|jgi:AraC-like DNA-binding protein
MLLETVEYQNDLPFTIFFSNVAEEDFHYHNEMKMLFVLRGTTNCKIHNVLYTLKEGDLLIVDTLDMHRIFDSSPDILTLDMYVDLGFFTDLYPDIDYMIFACEDYSKTSTLKYQDLQRKVSVLKHYVAKTALTYFNEPNNRQLLMDCINDLVFTLVNQFQGFFIEDNKFKADHGGPNDVDLSRLYKIIKYIYLNYDKKITLEDLSNIVYLNPYYISHLIKNTSGLSFQNFLNYVRLEYAEKMLVENKLTLTQISQSCGFSSLSYFNKCFKAWYNMTPAEYRARLKPCERCSHGPFSKEAAMSLLEPYLLSPHSQRSSEHLDKSSHHIFIPVKYSYRSGKKFKISYPLKILLSSDEDLFMLNYRKEKIIELNPNAIVLDYKLLAKKQSKQEIMSILLVLQTLDLPLQVSIPDASMDRQTESLIKSLGIPIVSSDATAEKTEKAGEKIGSNGSICADIGETYTVCAALAYMLKNPAESIRLSGKSMALFTPEGLLTPFYFAYSVFSQISGVITEHRDQYMIIKSKKAVYILVFQTNENTMLKAHIHIKGIRGKKYIIKKSFMKEHNCFVTLKALKHPTVLTDFMKSHINDISAGTVQLSCVETKERLDMNFDMDPESLTFLEIRNIG